MVRQTACRHCGQDIEGFSPWPQGEWRDRGNNTHCDDGKLHAPVAEGDTTTFRKLEVGEPFEFVYSHNAAGFERGPWVKISARRYEKPSMTCRVGSINVFVRRVLEP